MKTFELFNLKTGEVYDIKQMTPTQLEESNFEGDDLWWAEQVTLPEYCPVCFGQFEDHDACKYSV